MIDRLKPKSEFSKNVLTLMTGTTIAQAIPIAISPILTRIYSPQDFGVLALFVAISSIFGSIANGRYELAIMLPKKDEDAINIFALGFIIVSILSIFLLLIVVVFHDNILHILKNENISMWLYFIPISVFFIGVFNLLNYFNTRKKQFKDLAQATVLKSIITAVVQLGIGFLSSSATGLISGQLASWFVANIKLVKNTIKNKILISKISKVKIVALAKKYKDFPKFTMWAGLLNTSSTHFTNILISSMFNIKTLGFYSLSQRMLGIPSSLIGSSIGQVFFQEAMKEKHTIGTSLKVFKTTLKKLLIISIPFFVIMFIFVEDIFAFIFGEEWRMAGIYTKSLVPFFMIQFIVSPLTAINQIYLKNKNVMFWQGGLLIIYLIILYISKQIHAEFIDVLKYFSIYLSLYYLFHLFLLYYYIIKDINE